MSFLFSISYSDVILLLDVLLMILSPSEGVVDDSAVTCVSCQYMCGVRQFGRGGPPQCFCDEECLQYGDCCYDYTIYCEGNMPKEKMTSPDNITTDTAIQNILSIADGQGRYDLECLPIPQPTLGDDGGQVQKWFLLVNKCKEPVQPQYQHAKAKCEEDSTISSDISVKTPVLYNELFYKNMHCLFCSLGQVNESDVTFTEPAYTCINKTHEARSKVLFKTQSFAVFHEYIAAKLSVLCENLASLPIHVPRYESCLHM